MKEYTISKTDSAACKNCSWNIKRPDMKNVKYCVKRNFAIYDDGQVCTKYIRRKNNG